MRKRTNPFDNFIGVINQYLTEQAPVWGERLSRSCQDCSLARSEISRLLRNILERRRARFATQKRNIESLLYALKRSVKF
jgi:hypothetical protein